jgi:hypothetical protein
MRNNDDQLDSMIRARLASKLDPQLGRARERFLREAVAAPPMRLAGTRDDRPHRPLRLFGWTAGIAGAAIAAGIAVVMILGPALEPHGPGTPDAGTSGTLAQNDPRRHGSTDPDTPGPSGDVVLVDVEMPQDVEHALSWNTIDQGTIYLQGEMPLRSVVRQANETVRWYDPQRRAHIELTVPRDEVMFVGYPSH